jgi:hypothetical protein
MNVQKRNITILTFIAIFGISIFVIFFNILGKQTKETRITEKTSTKIETPESTTPPPVVMESIKPVKKVTPPPNNTTSTPIVETAPEVVTSPVISPPKVTNIYKDGTYNFTLSYRVPEGNTEKITSSISLEGDIIKIVKNTNSSTNRTSREYQAGFENKIQSATIGKKIDTLNLESVGGASLTTNAFNQGVSQVKSQAKN